MLWRSALRADSTAMLALGSRRETHCVRCAHSVQTVATSVFLMRAARADPRPALLVATEIAATGCRLPRGNIRGVRDENHRWIRKGELGQAAARL
jgi:spore maturation protein SpmA